MTSYNDTYAQVRQDAMSQVRAKIVDNVSEALVEARTGALVDPVTPAERDLSDRVADIAITELLRDVFERNDVGDAGPFRAYYALYLNKL
jgi:hypothetical protein